MILFVVTAGKGKPVLVLKILAFKVFFHLLMKRTKTFLFLFHSYGFLAFCAFILSLGILPQSLFSLEFSSAIALAVFGVYNGHRLLKFRQSKLTREINEWLSKNLLAIRSFVVFGLALSCVLFIHLFSLFSSAIFLL